MISHSPYDERSAQHQHVTTTCRHQWWQSSKSLIAIVIIIDNTTPSYCIPFAIFHHLILIPTPHAHTVRAMKDPHNNTSLQKHITNDYIHQKHRCLCQWYYISRNPPGDCIMFMTFHHLIRIPTPHVHTVRVMKAPHNKTSFQQHIINNDIHHNHRIPKLSLSKSTNCDGHFDPFSDRMFIVNRFFWLRWYLSWRWSSLTTCRGLISKSDKSASRQRSCGASRSVGRCSSFALIHQPPCWGSPNNIRSIELWESCHWKEIVRCVIIWPTIVFVKAYISLIKSTPTCGGDALQQASRVIPVATFPWFNLRIIDLRQTHILFDAIDTISCLLHDCSRPIKIDAERSINAERPINAERHIDA